MSEQQLLLAPAEPAVERGRWADKARVFVARWELACTALAGGR
jgi:hypothetical protein